MPLIDRVRESLAQYPAASLCVRCILVRDGRRALVATMVRMVQLAEARGSVAPLPQNALSPLTVLRTGNTPVSGSWTAPATLRASTHVAEGA